MNDIFKKIAVQNRLNKYRNKIANEFMGMVHRQVHRMQDNPLWKLDPKEHDAFHNKIHQTIASTLAG